MHARDHLMEDVKFHFIERMAKVQQNIRFGIYHNDYVTNTKLLPTNQYLKSAQTICDSYSTIGEIETKIVCIMYTIEKMFLFVLAILGLQKKKKKNHVCCNIGMLFTHMLIVTSL